MIKPEDVVLHVGYPKAASTWLQERVFTDEFGFQTPWPTNENAAAENFILRNLSGFDPAAVRKEFLAACREDGGAPVLSYETLVGNPILGQYKGFETADRLAETFPDAKVLIIFRAQEAYAYSAWTEHVRRGGATSIDDYLNDQNVPPGYRPFCPYEFLSFHDLIEYYHQLFDNRVLALPMEAIPSGEALTHMAAFLKNDRLRKCQTSTVYQGFQGGTIRFMRYANRFSSAQVKKTDTRQSIMYLAYKFDRILPKSIHQKCRQSDKDEIKAVIEGRFTESNRRLQQLTPCDLSKLGYQL